MKTFTKVMAALGVVALKAASVMMTILTKVATILAGPLLFFVIGCGIYCAATSNWKNLMILVAISGAIVILFLFAGLLLGLMDVAGKRMSMFVKRGH